jgi:hypothetical protein
MAERWAWRIGDGSPEGPFVNREAALRDAKKRQPEATVNLGKAVLLLPTDYVNCIDINWVLEQMDENLEFNPDEAVFIEKDGAEEALKEALKKWAEEYVDTNVDWFMMDEESVNLQNV